jgi:hypothetical protein
VAVRVGPIFAAILVWTAALGCGCGEITQQDQYTKVKKLDDQAQKNPRDGGMER